MELPQIIMQTYKNKNIPEHWKQSQLSVKKYMPKWKYVFMNDADNLDFVVKHFPQLETWFKNLKFGIQRADVIRYMWLYVNGGIYMDLDIELVTSLEPLFENMSMSTWLVKAPRNLLGHYTNFLMASAKHNPFWIDVLKECTKPLEWWVYLPHHIISQQTGISALNRAIQNWKLPIATLPFHNLVPCDYCSSDLCDRPFYYTKFLKGQSWNNLDTHMLNFFSCNYDILVIISVVCLFYVLVLKTKK